MPKAYHYFERKYDESKKVYTTIKNLRKAMAVEHENESFETIHKRMALKINENQSAIKMVLSKYDLLREENMPFLSKVEKNDMNSVFHLINQTKEDGEVNFLTSLLEHEANYFDIKKNILAANLIQDRERLFFMKIINQYDLPVDKFANEMQLFDNNNILSAFQYLSDWFDNVGVIDPKEKFLVIVMALSKIIYAEEIKSASVPDMSYKTDLADQLLGLYDHPEKKDREILSEEEHISDLKVMHTLSFFASQLIY